MRPRLASSLLALLLVGGGSPGLAQRAPDAELPTFVFDDFADAGTGWTVRADATYDMGYRDGAYRITMTGRTPLQLASAGHTVADGRVAIRLREVTPSAAHPAGLFVRAEDPANFYGFVVGSDGSFVVFHYEGGVFVLDSPDGATLPKGLYRAAPAENDLAVEMGARRLVFLLNHVEVFRIEEALWTDGVAGVLAANLTDLPAGTVFDHWRIDRFTCPISPRPVCAPG